MWTFYDFTDGRGTNPIRGWLDGLPKKAASKINTRILFMMAIPRWPEQYVSSLVGWPELIEFRVVHAGVQYRPLGFYGPERREFTIVLGTVEKGAIPSRVLEVADANRRLIVATGRSRICEHEFDQTTDARIDEGK
jgi:hypothetical protein